MRTSAFRALALALALALTLVAGLPLRSLQAATAPPAGTALTITQVDDTGATGWHYLVGWGIPLLGMLLGAKGVSKFGGGREGDTGKGGLAVGGGILAQLIPGWITGTGTAGQGAILGLMLPAVNTLQSFLAGLRGQSLWHDPVFWCAATVAIFLLVQRQPRLAHG